MDREEFRPLLEKCNAQEIEDFMEKAMQEIFNENGSVFKDKDRFEFLMKTSDYEDFEAESKTAYFDNALDLIYDTLDDRIIDLINMLDNTYQYDTSLYSTIGKDYLDIYIHTNYGSVNDNPYMEFEIYPQIPLSDKEKELVNAFAGRMEKFSKNYNENWRNYDLIFNMSEETMKKFSDIQKAISDVVGRDVYCTIKSSFDNADNKEIYRLSATLTEEERDKVLKAHILVNCITDNKDKETEEPER